MPKCKPGDLAVVVNAQHRCNLGRIVRVVCPDDGTGDLVFEKIDDTVWWVESSATMTWSIGKKRFRRRKGPVSDGRLQPIRGKGPKGPVLGTMTENSMTVEAENVAAWHDIAK